MGVRNVGRHPAKCRQFRFIRANRWLTPIHLLLSAPRLPSLGCKSTEASTAPNRDLGALANNQAIIFEGYSFRPTQRLDREMNKRDWLSGFNRCF